MNTMMLKVQIQTLTDELEIELKTDQDLYRLLIISSKSDFNKDPGRAWHGASANRELVEALSHLITQCYHSPHQPTHITILDGMHVRLHYAHNATAFTLSLNDFEEGSNEALLIRSLLACCKQLLHDDSFDRYAASLESYVG